MKSLKWLLVFLRPLSGLIGQSVLLSTASIASAVGLLATSAYLIAMAALRPSIAVLQIAIVGVRFFGISRAILRYFERLVSHSLNFRLLTQIRLWFYNTVEPLSPAGLTYFRSGDLLNRSIIDIDGLENFYIRGVSPPLTAILVTIGLALFFGKYHILLAAVVVAGLVLHGVVLPIVIHWLSKRYNPKIIEERGLLNSALVDLTQGLSDLMVNNHDKTQYGLIESLSENIGKKQIASGLITAGANAVGLLFSNLTLLVIIIVAVPLVNSGQLGGVMLPVLVLACLAAFEAVAPLLIAAQQLETSMQSAQRLMSLAEISPTIEDAQYPQLLGSIRNLEISQLSFRYVKDAPFALINIDLSLSNGRKVGIVGPSGAGKSTLSNILLRFWDYSDGSICLNGRELKGYKAEEIRKEIGYVSQSTYIFCGSLRENLTLAKPQASDGELWQVIEKVGLKTWVQNLEDGLDTWVGEFGRLMSGGERQRLAIARILLQDASMVILDEPTSNLDYLNENQIIKVLHQAFQGRCVLWITHRMIGLEEMDEIVVMSEGRIIERGNHHSLLQKQSAYAQMWQMDHEIINVTDEYG